MKKLLRAVFRRLMHNYKREHGRYSILTKFYYPYLAPRKGELEKITVVTNKHIINLDVDSNEYVQSLLYVFGDYEPATVSFIERAIEPGHCVIDVGANVGFISLVCAKCTTASGVVHGFEPDPKNYSYYQQNIRLNTAVNIISHQKALSKEAGVLKLYHSKIDHNDGAHSLIYNERVVSSDDYVEIQALRFDEFTQTVPVPKLDFVKIDVEGAELDVIEGMSERIKSDRPIMLIEVSAEYFNYRGMSILGFKDYMLKEFGMVSYRINDDGSIRLSTKEEFFVLDNLVFISSDKEKEIVARINK
jgi:FkbM family methyltransferase